MYITSTEKDSLVESLGENFVEICLAQFSTLSMTAVQATALQTLFTEYATSLQAVETKTKEKEAAVTAKEGSKDAFLGAVRGWAKKFRANNAIPDELLTQLAVAPHSTPRPRTNPKQPVSLIAEPNAAGTVFLTWEKNGNTANTSYQIETQTPGDADWTIVGSTSRAKFTFTGAELGQPLSFRVTALRRDLQSLPSLPVSIWANGGSSLLQIAA